MARTSKAKPTKTLEQRLWEAADELRGNQEPSEYKHVVLGLVFLKYISDAFVSRRVDLESELCNEESADYIPNADRRAKFLELREEYTGHNVFWVPEDARWDYLQSKAKLPEIGQLIDQAMDLIEKDNPQIRGVLPRNYGREELDKSRLGSLVDLIGSIGFTETDDHGSDDVLGRVYEYFLGQFAGKETGKDAGAFYTPRSVVRLLVEMLEPYKGRVYDPACGSGGMFVQSAEFVTAHGGKTDDIAIYGQEYTATTWKLAKMNLALRGIEADLGDRAADSFVQDLHRDLRADYVLANPPFNMSKWWSAKLADDPRWRFGTPPEGNANFAWAEHIVHHLAPRGRAGFVLANMSLASDSADELRIRRALVDANLVDCIVTLPDKLFTNTPIAVCLWFIDKSRVERGAEDILFIDASLSFVARSRTSNLIANDKISAIANQYHLWRRGESLPEVSGVRAASAKVVDVASKNYVLLPAAYTASHRPDSGLGLEKMADALASNGLGVAIDSMGELGLAQTSMAAQVRELLQQCASLDLSFDEFRLGDLLEQSKETLGDREEPEVLTCTEGSGLVLQRERFASRVATENTTKYKRVSRGDIVYNPYLLWKGSIDQCWIVDEGITSPAYEVFRVKDGYNVAIVGSIVTSREMVRRYDGISFGTVERRRRAAPANFLDLKVMLPTGPDADRLGQLLDRLRELQMLGRLVERGFRESATEITAAIIAARNPSGLQIGEAS